MNEQQLKAALNEVALLKAKLNELGLTKSSKSMERVVRTVALEIADQLKASLIKGARKKTAAAIDQILQRPSSKLILKGNKKFKLEPPDTEIRYGGILDLHKNGQAMIPQKEWEAFVRSMEKHGRPPKEKTLWDTPAAQKLVKAFRKKK